MPITKNSRFGDLRDAEDAKRSLKSDSEQAYPDQKRRRAP